ncbi:hypothetical protein K438DRAFT_1957575 [Mycena galopus ATCC 62051]|nr:hypothetical protein K438DRAFT_1957575 [Mycena galopus ATCC 62051]
MSLTRPALSKPKMKLEDVQDDLKLLPSSDSGTNIIRKRPRIDFETDNDASEDTGISSGRVKIEDVPTLPNNCGECASRALHTQDARTRLLSALEDAIQSKDAIHAAEWDVSVLPETYLTL